jgi:hypothetical protein
MVNGTDDGIVGHGGQGEGIAPTAVVVESCRVERGVVKFTGEARKSSNAGELTIAWRTLGVNLIYGQLDRWST